jgi:hypothetical protein
MFNVKSSFYDITGTTPAVQQHCKSNTCAEPSAYLHPHDLRQIPAQYLVQWIAQWQAPLQQSSSTATQTPVQSPQLPHNHMTYVEYLPTYVEYLTAITGITPAEQQHCCDPNGTYSADIL